MSAGSDVLVVGSYNQDLSWRCGDFPEVGQTIVGRFATGPGGKGSNQAVAAVRAGAATAFVCALGRDAFGAQARDFLRKEGLRLRAVIKPDPTGNAAILVDGRARNQIVVALGANLALRPSDVPLNLVKRARVVVCQFESALATVAGVLCTARLAGAVTVLNPAPMRERLDPHLLRNAHVLVPNESEFISLVRSVAGRSLTPASLRRMKPRALHGLCRRLGVPVVIVTLGDRGCFVSEPDAATVVPPHRVEAVDTTGAGDAFVGALAAGIVKFGGDLAASARFANAAAALSVTRPGTAPSMPRLREIERLAGVTSRA